ncbi:hypothetical protein OESDEN_17538 [Oesophagostomum dentatum]|uniref:Uncharacterized protein n=1 Tax=Oesophagostomum dentatum TaxID=61180 RepID=A0A0B1SGV3_OESDE|nr:hypothetical protein OESDEN_17538 [Oesophagostomum dentatum]
MEIGKKVYYAPKADQYTKTVIETQLQKQTDLDESISDDEAMFSDDEKEKEYRSRKAAGAKTSQVDNPTENNKKSGKRNRVQFSDSTVPQRGRGRGAHPHGRGRGGSWNWHSGRGGFSSRGQHHRRGQNNGSASAVGPSVANTDNLYAEWGCYGGIPFTDSRQL